MVRTKAGSVSTKAVGGKAPQKVTARAVVSGNASKNKNTGGNPYHPRETPEWQKPITFFMKQNSQSTEDESDEITGLPGIRGIEVNFPQSSGIKTKVKDVRDKESSNENENKQAENKKMNRKDDTELDVKETVKDRKYRNHDVADLHKNVKEMIEGNVGDGGTVRDDRIFDMAKAMDVKENVKNDKESHCNVDMEPEGEISNVNNNCNRTNVDGMVILDNAKAQYREGFAAGSIAEREQDRALKDEVNDVGSKKMDEDKG